MLFNALETGLLLFLMDFLGDQAPYPTPSLLKKTITVDSILYHSQENARLAKFILLTGG